MERELDLGIVGGHELQGVETATTIRLDGQKATVTDGPFSEAKEVIGGYALLRAASKEEIVKHTKRFLEVAGQGTCEIYQLYEPPAGN